MSTTKFDARNTINHNDLVKKVIASPHLSPLMGVTGQSPLHELIGFDPTASLPRDLMHDFLEGLCPIVIMCLLKHACSMRLLTYGESSLFSTYIIYEKDMKIFLRYPFKNVNHLIFVFYYVFHLNILATQNEIIY